MFYVLFISITFMNNFFLYFGVYKVRNIFLTKRLMTIALKKDHEYLFCWMFLIINQYTLHGEREDLFLKLNVNYVVIMSLVLAGCY